MLKIAGVAASYGRTDVFRDVSLEVAPGQTAVLLGRNGAGKTTLLKCVTGLVAVRAGAISLKGRLLTSLPAHVVARQGIGYASQSNGLFGDLTVSENLRVGASSTSQRLLAEVLREFPVPSEWMRRKASTLSGGEQQQIKFVRALSRAAELLVLDEISQGVHTDVLPRFVSSIQRYAKQRRVAVLIAEQNWELAEEVGDTLVELVDGQAEILGGESVLESD